MIDPEGGAPYDWSMEGDFPKHALTPQHIADGARFLDAMLFTDEASRVAQSDQSAMNVRASFPGIDFSNPLVWYVFLKGAETVDEIIQASLQDPDAPYKGEAYRAASDDAYLVIAALASPEVRKRFGM